MFGKGHFIGFHIGFSKYKQLINQAKQAPRIPVNGTQVFLAIGAIRWRWPLGRSIAAGATVSGLILALLLIRPGLVPMAAILAASGLAESSLTPWAQTIRMRLIPAELRGRVFALLRTSMQSTRPLGAILAGTPQIREIDLNPVVVYPRGEGIVALDALMLVS